MNKNKVVYISGPISGLANGNFQKFYEAKKKLEKEGYIVLNPHEICKELYDKFATIKEPTKEEIKQHWVYCMKECMKHLMISEIIFLLDNWETSEGSIIELVVAQKIKIPIYYIKDYSPFDVSFQISKFERVPI